MMGTVGLSGTLRPGIVSPSQAHDVMDRMRFLTFSLGSPRIDGGVGGDAYQDEGLSTGDEAVGSLASRCCADVARGVLDARHRETLRTWTSITAAMIQDRFVPSELRTERWFSFAFSGVALALQVPERAVGLTNDGGCREMLLNTAFTEVSVRPGQVKPLVEGSTLGGAAAMAVATPGRSGPHPVSSTEVATASESARARLCIVA